MCVCVCICLCPSIYFCYTKLGPAPFSLLLNETLMIFRFRVGENVGKTGNGVGNGKIAKHICKRNSKRN